MNTALKETVIQLPLEDRLELLDAILESVTDTDQQLAPLNPAQRDLVRSRLERMQRAAQPGIPWRDFMAKLEAS